MSPVRLGHGLSVDLFCSRFSVLPLTGPRADGYGQLGNFKADDRETVYDTRENHGQTKSIDHPAGE